MNEKDSTAETKVREVNYSHSREFVDLLKQLDVSLLVSTYQAGKLCVIGHREGSLYLSFHNFQQAMGIAVAEDRIAVGSRSQVWVLQSTPDIARHWIAQGKHDACYLCRTCYVTDDIHGHEMAWSGNDLWLVNTRFSCLCTLDTNYSFVPRWKPPFITQLAAEDRCHLNGLALENGQPKLVSAMAESDTAGGWRETKATTGCLIDLESGETISRGFAMPHSPRVHLEQTWLLDSGRGELTRVDRNNGSRETVSRQPGYTRGLDFAGPIAFVGLSRIRETSTFGGVPIADMRDQLKCGVAAVDLRSGKHLAHFEFTSGVEEIFDVRVLPRITAPFLNGPHAALEQEQSIWYAPSAIDLPSKLDLSQSSTLPSGPGTKDAESPESHVKETAAKETDNLDALNCFREGNRFSRDSDWEQAIKSFHKALDHDPDFPSARCNLGVAQQFAGLLDESVATLQETLRRHPRMPAAHMNLSMSLFLSHQWSEAWPEYDWRWKCERFKKDDTPTPKIASKWRGESLKGKTICVFGEQGIGDEIMFGTLIGRLTDLARQVVVLCQPRLVPLFRRALPDCAVLAASHANFDLIEDLHRPDYQIPMGSLGGRLGFDSPAAPCQAAYLSPDEGQARRWQKFLNSDRPRIGISWRGGANKEEISKRSTRPSDWTSLLELDHFDLINIQYGSQPPELREWDELPGKSLISYPECDPLLDMDGFAALLSNLDLVISVDNSTVHLAGALGVPTWALVAFPSSSYWRWGMEGESTAWYESVRLVRKSVAHTWADTLAGLAEELQTTFRTD